MAHSSRPNSMREINSSPSRPSISGTKRARSLDDDELVPSPLTKRSKAALIRRCQSAANHEHSSSLNDVDYKEYVVDNIQSLSFDSTLSDVVFIVEGEPLYGIRALFAAHSPVFRRMLFGSMMESNPSNEVILSDITVAAFKYLRSTFYNVFDRESFDSVLSAQIVVDVLFSAQKYLIDPLVTKCISFIKSVENIDDWYRILRDFEASSFQIQSKVYLEEIFNPKSNDDAAYILQFESEHFLESVHFERLRAETVMVLIQSDFLAVKEHQIWESLLKWTRFNAPKMGIIKGAEDGVTVDGDGDGDKDAESENEADRDETKESEDGALEQKEADKEREEMTVDRGDGDDSSTTTPSINSNLSATEMAMMAEFTRYIRFSQMDATYFRECIVDRQILPQRDVIEIMFCRENGTKWNSKFIDSPRHKTRRRDSFRLNEVALSLNEVAALSVGDEMDFRDLYGLFCSATVMEVEHNEHRIKLHYNNWGSNYDEWFVYKEQSATNNTATANTNRSRDRPRCITLSQQDLLHRMARHQAITGRKALRQPFKDKVEAFKSRGFRRSDANESTEEVQVKLPMAFWKKNQHFMERTDRYIGQWLNAKIIGFKTALKYSEHIKVGLYVNGDHFEYWVHPDNADEVRPMPGKGGDALTAQ